MENKFFIDSEHLSESALNKKHLLETDPSSIEHPSWSSAARTSLAVYFE